MWHLATKQLIFQEEPASPEIPLAAITQLQASLSICLISTTLALNTPQRGARLLKLQLPQTQHCGMAVTWELAGTTCSKKLQSYIIATVQPLLYSVLSG